MERNTTLTFIYRLVFWTLNAMAAWGVVGGCLVDAPETFIGQTGASAHLLWIVWKGFQLGGVISIGQWLLLQNLMEMTCWWMPVTILAYGIGYPLAFSTSNFFSWLTPLGRNYDIFFFSQERITLSCVVYFIMVGFISAWIQWVLLQRYLVVDGVQISLLWLWGSAVAWTLGYIVYILLREMIGMILISNIGMGLVVGVISGLILFTLSVPVLDKAAK